MTTPRRQRRRSSQATGLDQDVRQRGRPRRRRPRALPRRGARRHRRQRRRQVDADQVPVRCDDPRRRRDPRRRAAGQLQAHPGRPRGRHRDRLPDRWPSRRPSTSPATCSSAARCASRARSEASSGMLDHGAMRQRAKEQLQALGIGTLQKITQAVETLSGGQRQAVAVARAAAFGSKVIILDEPTAALGVRESGQVLKLIRDLRDRGMPVILISHNMPHVFEVADRIHIQRLGRGAAVDHAEVAHPDGRGRDHDRRDGRRGCPTACDRVDRRRGRGAHRPDRPPGRPGRRASPAAARSTRPGRSGGSAATSRSSAACRPTGSARCCAPRSRPTASTFAGRTTEAPTTLAIAELDDDGGGHVRFHTAGHGRGRPDPRGVRAALREAPAAVHVGTLGLVVEPMATAIGGGVAGPSPATLLMVDPNCRPGVIADRDAYLGRLGAILARRDIVKASVDDLAYIAPATAPVERRAASSRPAPASCSYRRPASGPRGRPAWRSRCVSRGEGRRHGRCRRCVRRCVPRALDRARTTVGRASAEAGAPRGGHARDRGRGHHRPARRSRPAPSRRGPRPLIDAVTARLRPCRSRAAASCRSPSPLFLLAARRPGPRRRHHRLPDAEPRQSRRRRPGDPGPARAPRRAGRGRRDLRRDDRDAVKAFQARRACGRRASSARRPGRS